MILNLLSKSLLLICCLLVFLQNGNANNHFTKAESLFAPEDCYNGIDDDGDGYIDLDDLDCLCAVEIDTSNLITNPSFENVVNDPQCIPDYNGCFGPDTYNDGCVEGWINTNNAILGPDYFNTCYANNSPFTWPNINNFQPNDNAFVKMFSSVSAGNFFFTSSEFLGTTLISPLVPNTTYEFRVQLNSLMFAGDTIQLDPTLFSLPLNYSLYGHVTENNYPYPNANLRCPTNQFPSDYVELGNYEMITNSDGTWIEIVFQFTAPTEIKRIVFGTGCNQEPLPFNNYPFYTFSTLVDSIKLREVIPAMDTTSLKVDFVDISSPCDNETTLQANALNGATYQWYFNNNEITNATESILSFENSLINSGEYAVQVTDNMGACGVSQPIEITYTAPVQLSESITYIDCYEENTGAIDLMIDDPTGLIFLWENEQGQTISNDQNIENLSAGSYLLEITDDNGCNTNYEFEITQPDELQLSAVAENVNCENDLGSISIDVQGGTPNYSYSVNGINFSANPYFELPDGSYDLTVLDDNNCEQTLNDIIIETPEELFLEIIPSSTSIELGETVDLELIASQSLNNATIQWTPQNGLDCGDCISVEANIFETTDFQILITENGCETTANISIQVIKNRNVFIPNSFSPNGDGLNDNFEILTGQGVDQVISFKIFNRWGALLFDNPNQGWDGEFQNKTVDIGVYVWVAEVRFLDGLVQMYQGDVTVTR